jgi:DNA-binding beta-propeller fold protein YncE
MSEMINYKYTYRVIIFLWTLFVLLPFPANAESPWKWQMSLHIETPGDAMYMPSGVAFDTATERYYAVDTGHNRLVSFSRDGQMLKAFSADDRLLAPFDMVRLDNGQLWVVEKGRNSVTLIDVAAKEVKPYLLKDGDRQVFPDRIAYAGQKLYVLDRASGQVLRLNADMVVEQRFGCPDCLDGFVDFVLLNDSVWTLETLSKKLYRFQSDGKIVETLQLEGQVDFPVSLAVDSSGSFYILDRHQHRIVVFSPEGHFQYTFLELGQGPEQLYFPRQLRFDPWGRLCVVDEGNGRVEVFSR